MYHNNNKTPSWVIRGHIRQPNLIVRGLYGVFDWFGDFKPMISAFFGSIGRLSLVITNLVILVGTIILSASHSLELLRDAGFMYGLEWIAVIVWESCFIFSSIILSNDFKKGNLKSGWAPWLGFLLGFGFVELSNISGMSDTWIGRAIGICTPILLLVSKGLLAHQFKKKSNQPTESISQVDLADQVERAAKQIQPTEPDQPSEPTNQVDPNNQIEQPTESISQVEHATDQPG
ncbi:hypothetical protein EDD58_11416, partial [Hazenella coriacea]